MRRDFTHYGEETTVDTTETFLTDNRCSAMDKPPILGVRAFGIIDKLRPRLGELRKWHNCGSKSALDRF